MESFVHQLDDFMWLQHEKPVFIVVNMFLYASPCRVESQATWSFKGAEFEFKRAFNVEYKKDRADNDKEIETIRAKAREAAAKEIYTTLLIGDKVNPLVHMVKRTIN